MLNNLLSLVYQIFCCPDKINRMKNKLSEKAKPPANSGEPEKSKTSIKNQVIQCEENYRDLFDNATDAIYILDKNACFIDVNKGAVKMYGYSREEFFGKTPEFLSAPGKNDFAYVLDRLKDAYHGKPQKINFWGLRKNGEAFPKIVRLYEGRYAGHKVVMAFAIDITEQLRTQEEQKKRLQYEKVISKISQYAINPCNLDDFQNKCLSVLGKNIDVSRVYIFQYHTEKDTYDNTHEWVNVGIEPHIHNIKKQPAADYSWWTEMCKANKVINYSNIEEIPDENVVEVLKSQNIKSILIVPLQVNKSFYGFLGFDECLHNREWPNADVELLLAISRIISTTIERSIAEEALIKSRQNTESLYNLLRTVSDNMTDMLWAKDMDKKFLFANQSICNKILMASSTEEPIGKTDMFFTERERKKHKKNPEWHTFGEICTDSDQVIIDTGKPGHFEEFGNVKGEFLFLDVNKSPLLNENGEMIGVVGSARDVTNEKRIQEELRKSEEKFKEIIHSVSEGIVYVGPKGKVLYANQSLCSITGLKANDLIGKGVIGLAKKLISVNQLPSLLSIIKRAFNMESINPFELVFNDKVLEISVYFDPKTKNITGILRDITLRKQGEEELNMYRENLEELVKVRTKDLEEKNDKLERFNELFVGREFRIKELKEDIAALKQELSTLKQKM